MNKATAPYNGILIFHKPQDFTSHDVVAKLRGILGTRKIGHGGTLDPMATGVLPIFVGGATKAADYAASQDKEYIAGFTLGYQTDTQDTTGKITQMSGQYASKEMVLRRLQHFLGAQQQLPPMYSAVQVNGQRLYDLARKGVEVERQPREIFIREIELLDFDEDAQTGRFRVICSKGTYVRTIVHDFGVSLGTFAAMHSLQRTRAGSYDLSQAVDFAILEQTKAQAGEENETPLAQFFLPTDSLFLDLPAVHLTDEGNDRALRGAVCFARHTQGFPQAVDTISRVYYGEQFVMLGQTRTLDIGGMGLFVHKNFR